jgi:hypothetical protein
MLLKKLWRWDDHAIARLRRMYAGLLLVVVGIFETFLADLRPFRGSCGLASPDAADIRLAA